MPYDTYRAEYFRRLNSLDITALKKHLKDISAGRDLVLLCFENLGKEGEWCHRRMFAEWWEKKTGQKAVEL